MWKWTLGVALVVGLVAGATPALADTMYWVEIEWTSGLLTGTTSIGSGTFDESVLTGGNGLIGPDGAIFVLDGDLTFAIVVDGVSFTEMDDIGYPAEYPQLLITNGAPIGGVYDAHDAGTGLAFSFGGAAFTDAAGNTSVAGPPAYSLTNPIPEPASLALFGLGAVGLGVVRRRRRRAAA